MKTLITTLFPAMLLAACANSVDFSLPDSQQQLCAIVSESRDLYEKEAKKGNYIDKRKNLDTLHADRDNKLKKALGDGLVEGWKGELDGISTLNNETHISIKLGCGVGLETGEIFFIEQGTPVYEALRQIREKDVVFVTGRLTHSYDANRLKLKQLHFDERRATQAGSMDNPEFLFIVEGIGKTAEESRNVAKAQRQANPIKIKTPEQIIAASEKSFEKCKKNIKCISGALINEVEYDCKRLIKNATTARAKYEYDLDDGLFSNMFERVTWRNSKKKEIVYYGSKARFKNRSGAWEANEYACIVDIDKKQVVVADYVTR